VAFVVVYDACVLYPAPLRDLLVRLAQSGPFQAKWSEMILDEMVKAITRQRPDLEAKLQRTRDLMKGAVRDATVTDFEQLVDAIELPDADDRHVVAVAIRSGAQVIVTSNLRDFPSAELSKYDIEAQSPDEFVSYVLELAPARVVEAVQQQAASLKNPPQTVDDVLTRLASQGLPGSVARIRALR